MNARTKAVVRWVTLVPAVILASYVLAIIVALLGRSVVADFYLSFVVIPALKGVVLVSVCYWWSPSHKLTAAFWMLFVFCLFFLSGIKGLISLRLGESGSVVLQPVPGRIQMLPVYVCSTGSAVLTFIGFARHAEVEERRAALRRWWLAAIILAVVFLFPTPSLPSP